MKPLFASRVQTAHIIIAGLVAHCVASRFTPTCVGNTLGKGLK